MLATTISFVFIADTCLGVNSCLPPTVGVLIRVAVPLHAAHRSGLLGFELLRQLNVPSGAQLLLCHHIPGLQW